MGSHCKNLLLCICAAVHQQGFPHKMDLGGSFGSFYMTCDNMH